MAQSSFQWERPLIVGASGQVGAELYRALGQSGAAGILRSSRNPPPGWLNLDLGTLLRPGEIAAALQGAAPDLILCAGAMTFVDGCEEQPDLAFRANAYGPAALAAFAGQRGIPFVYFSSDYVFDGTAHHPGPYDETAEPCPVSVYGRSKLEGERAVLRVYPGALVVRTSWVYGPDAAGKNFITALLRQLRAGMSVRVPSDQISTPTLNRDLAQVTLALAAGGYSGVVHVTGPELVSRVDLAKHAARHFGLETSLIEGVPTASLGQRARRPLLSGLVGHRLPRGKEFSLRTLAEGLDATGQALAT